MGLPRGELLSALAPVKTAFWSYMGPGRKGPAPFLEAGPSFLLYLSTSAYTRDGDPGVHTRTRYSTAPSILPKGD